MTNLTSATCDEETKWEVEGENKDIWSESLDQFCYLGNMICGKVATSYGKNKEETEEAEGVYFSSERQRCHVGQKG